MYSNNMFVKNFMTLGYFFYDNLCFFCNFIQRFCREGLTNFLFTATGWGTNLQTAGACQEGIEGDLQVVEAGSLEIRVRLQAVGACFMTIERAEN